MTQTRVLLVEDEPGYARFLREVLSETNGDAHRITWTATLEDGLAALSREAFDIVLLDLGLPDADGNEALLRVSAAAPATPIVVLSARNELDVALESMRQGAQEYLVKGQSEHDLLPRAIRYAIERKRLQDAASAARAEAERANAVKDEFLAMLGHELRNPLAPIVTALHLIRLRGGPGMERERMVIERQVRHLVRLVDDLLDVSRIARGKLELHRAPVDLAEVVGDGLEIARPLLEAQRHTLTVQVPAGSLVVDGDRARLGQVIANLLTNSAKYTNPGGAVSITATEESGHALLSVRDDGIGITPELLPRVFDLFEQEKRSIDRSVGGLGLGLAIVKNIVTLHGGSVTAASDGPGKGAEFSLRLPLHAVREEKAALRSEPPATTSDASR